MKGEEIVKFDLAVKLNKFFMLSRGFNKWYSIEEIFTVFKEKYSKKMIAEAIKELKPLLYGKVRDNVFYYRRKDYC